MVVLGLNIALPIILYVLIHHVLQFRSILLVLLLTVVILGIINYFYIIVPFFILEKAFLEMEQIQKENDTQIKLAESRTQTTELYALQTQISPHFLYNTLDSIRGLALIHNVKEISTMTEALSRLFRSMIAKEGQMLSLREEFENINHYLTIQDFRFNQRFDYENVISEQFLNQYQIPNMTLQPIVENAIMHGLEKKLGRGKITITGYATEKRLVLKVTDNGVGIEKDKLDYLNEKLRNYHSPIQREAMRYHLGIALLNINKQIKLKFGEQYGIYISSTQNIYTATELVLPAILIAANAGQENRYE